MKIFENKQLLHIICETIIMLGFVLYFTKKNKRIMNHINDLCVRIEEQEDLIQKQDEKINKLTKIIDNFFGTNYENKVNTSLNSSNIKTNENKGNTSLNSSSIKNKVNPSLNFSNIKTNENKVNLSLNSSNIKTNENKVNPSLNSSNQIYLLEETFYPVNENNNTSRIEEILDEEDKEILDEEEDEEILDEEIKEELNDLENIN